MKFTEKTNWHAAHTAATQTRSIPSAGRRHTGRPRRPALTYVCDGPCGRNLGRQQFPHMDWARRQKDKGKRLVCSQCKKLEVARENELREKLKTSRRRKCTCQQAIGHKQTCPMHVSYAGERPYPGCDVISREDSEWFHQRIQKPRLS